MNSQKIKKKLEIVLTKRSLQNKQYYIVESQIKPIKEKSFSHQINKKLTKIAISFNQISPTITKKILKFLLVIKIFKEYANLNKHLNQTLKTKNTIPSVIKIKTFLFKVSSIVSAYAFDCNRIFYLLKSISNKNTNLLLSIEV